MSEANPGAGPIVELHGVVKRFGSAVAVNDVSFAVEAGRTVGIVGESGCGKSTTARLIIGLERPDEGSIEFRGEAYPRGGRRLRELRRRIGFVFQDPYESLDPRFTVRELVAEPLRGHGLWRDGGRQRVDELLELVGLDGVPLDARAAELSGGQLQRIGIARALALDPELVICDEPTSALDVSVQAQILNLLLAIQAERQLAFLFISHDLDVVRRLADEVLVMYAGEVVERGPATRVVTEPSHPYTQALLSAVPALDPRERRLGKRLRYSGETAGVSD